MPRWLLLTISWAMLAATGLMALLFPGGSASLNERAAAIALTFAVALCPFDFIGSWIALKSAGIPARLITFTPFAVVWEDGRRKTRWVGDRFWTGEIFAGTETSPEKLRRALPALVTWPLVAALTRPVLFIVLIDVLISAGWIQELLLIFVLGIAVLASVARGHGLLQSFELLRLNLRGGESTESLLAGICCTWAAANGVRPSEWDPAWIDAMNSAGTYARIGVLGRLAGYYRALDLGEGDAAGQRLRMIAKYLKPTHPWYPATHLEMAYCDARYRFDAAGAKGHLQLARLRRAYEAHSELRAEAAVLLVEGDLISARARALEGLAHTTASLNPGLARLDAALLEELRAEIDDRAPGLIPPTIPDQPLAVFAPQPVRGSRSSS